MHVERKHAPTSVPPRDVHDRRAPAADVLEQPHVRVVVPRLARRADRAQRREVLLRLALRDQRADQRRRDAEQRHALLLDRRPEPVVRPVGRALEVDHGRAAGAGADDGPRPHDPAHVRREEDALAAVDVGLIRDLARDRDEEAGVHVQRALRPPGRARRVREEVRMLRVDLERRQLARAELDLPFAAVAVPLDDVPHRRCVAHRLVRDLAHRDRRPAAIRVACADERFRLRVEKPLEDRRRREAGEDRHLHCADVRARVRRDRRRRRHRHEDRDTVSGLDAERHERLGQPRHLERELRERQLAPLAVLAAEHRGRRGRRSPRPVVHAARARRSGARRRTTSPTRARRSRRPRRPTAARTRARDRPRPRARSAPALSTERRCSSW